MSTRRINELLNLFHQRTTIATTFGMTLSFTDEDAAVIELPYNPALDHGLGGVHGGVYMTLLDTAAWFTAAAAHEESCWVATSELTVHLLKPVEHLSLRAVGRMLQSGRRQDIAEAHLYDGEGRLVAHAVGTFILMTNLPLTSLPESS